MEQPIQIAIIIGALLISVIFHEMAHAWSALKLGDPTAKHENRLSWNPAYHIDPFMTLLLPAFLLIASNGTFAFGSAKPVPINPLNFRNPGRGMMISSAAGPASNVLLMILSIAVLFVLMKVAPQTIIQKDGNEYALTYNGYFFYYMMLLNAVLAAFNLIPIPPLDGSRILRYVLPQEGKEFIDRVEPYGLFIVGALIYFGGTYKLLAPVYALVMAIMVKLLEPGLF